ncbi:MAG: hypothetical protein E6J90_12610 [Deltaproteobacteria bacterium]|nr:MAG: hypothetical protein E6J91_34960 [Deltaproteobacteria bacterium]TMQ22346.1 MAG: hypothetical protein E6J90_12610 [Deltaproteobacteria bacterium]
MARSRSRTPPARRSDRPGYRTAPPRRRAPRAPRARTRGMTSSRDSCIADPYWLPSTLFRGCRTRYQTLHWSSEVEAEIAEDVTQRWRDASPLSRCFTDWQL